MSQTPYLTWRIPYLSTSDFQINVMNDFFSDLRTLVVDMVLATDMSSHFEQLRAMKATLTVLGR